MSAGPRAGGPDAGGGTPDADGPDADGPDRAALFVDDILATPDALDRLIEVYSASDGGPLAALTALDGPDPHGRRLVLTGVGSSRFAALAFSGTASVHVELASAPTIEPADDVVLVGISNSGNTAEVVNAIRAHRGRGVTIGLTNRPGRPVGSEADHVLPLLAGDERSGIACRTYAATLAVLQLLVTKVGEVGEASCGDVVRELRAAAAAARLLREGRAAWVGGAADVLDAADEIHVIGDGRHLGTLEQAALMLREAPRLRALPMDAGDWLHVGLYTMLPGSRAILFSGTPYDEEVAATIRRRGARFVAVGPPVEGAAVVVPLRPMPDGCGRASRAIAIAGAAELIAAELWARAGSALRPPRT